MIPCFGPRQLAGEQGGVEPGPPGGRLAVVVGGRQGRHNAREQRAHHHGLGLWRAFGPPPEPSSRAETMALLF